MSEHNGRYLELQTNGTCELIGTNAGEEVSGTLTVPEVSHECTDGISDYVVSTLSFNPHPTLPFSHHLSFPASHTSSNGHPPLRPTSDHSSNHPSYPSSSPGSTISLKNSSRQTALISLPPEALPPVVVDQEPLHRSLPSILPLRRGKYGPRRRMGRGRVGRRPW